jgi:hypothetical protein
VLERAIGIGEHVFSIALDLLQSGLRSIRRTAEKRQQQSIFD